MPEGRPELKSDLAAILTGTQTIHPRPKRQIFDAPRPRGKPGPKPETDAMALTLRDRRNKERAAKHARLMRMPETLAKIAEQIARMQADLASFKDSNADTP